VRARFEVCTRRRRRRRSTHLAASRWQRYWRRLGPHASRPERGRRSERGQRHKRRTLLRRCGGRLWRRQRSICRRSPHAQPVGVRAAHGRCTSAGRAHLAAVKRVLSCGGEGGDGGGASVAGVHQRQQVDDRGCGVNRDFQGELCTCVHRLPVDFENRRVVGSNAAAGHRTLQMMRLEILREHAARAGCMQTAHTKSLRPQQLPDVKSQHRHAGCWLRSVAQRHGSPSVTVQAATARCMGRNSQN
jgi:hypothetical protein